MTSEGSDLSSLKSWHSAFEYPLATTRQIEKALRADVSSNKDRLRTLVGYVRPMQLYHHADANIKTSGRAIETF